MREIIVSEESNLLNPLSLSFEQRERQIEQEKLREQEDIKHQKKSPYRRWVQMNKDAYKAEDWLMAKSPVAYRIFKFLINNMDSYNAVICSQQVLQETFDISRTTVARAIKLLKDKQYIDIFKSGTSNVYAVNKQIAWSSWGNNYQHGKFGANIILTESEQEEAVKAQIQVEKHKQIVIKDAN